MSDHKDRERLEALRQRLYERGHDDGFVSARRPLSPGDTVNVARGWAGVSDVQPVMTPPRATAADVVSPLPAPARSELDLPIEPLATPKPRRSYRLFILLGSLAAFVLMVGISSLYLFFGGNQISGRNISFVLSGPLAVAGGDVLQLQVGVNNMNSVAIEGATLIVNYPAGTRSVGEDSRDLLQERIPLNSIAAGEARTVPVQVAVFGEENEQKEVSATIEYRVAGSNGVFYKEADPLSFTINSSPLVLRVESVEKISSGQEFTIKLVVQSNALTPLQNVLVSAQYPESFTFVRSTPEPSYRQSEWFIENLAAKGTHEITIRGMASGLSDEAFIMRFQAGTPRTDNQFILGATLAQTSTTFTVERPFVDIGININSNTSRDMVLPAGSVTNVTISVTNTRSEPVYDMRVRVVPTGSAFQERLLAISDGFYNSVEKDIRWQPSGNAELGRVLPGEQRNFTFRLGGDTEPRTATLDLDVSVYARRVSESAVAEELIGAADASVRYSSIATVLRQADHERGPLPPVANRETIYSLTLAAAAGANDLTGAVVTAMLPQYVEWLNTVSGDGQVEFNPVNNQLRWNIGEITGRERREISFEIAVTPSVLQVDSAPVIMGRQELRATDRFTGAPLVAEAPPITTELSSDAGYERNNGLVRRAEDEEDQ